MSTSLQRGKKVRIHAAIRFAAVAAPALLAVAAMNQQASASDLYWDGADSSVTGNNAGTGANLGGTGVWDTGGSANWWDGVSTTADTVWTDGNVAHFAGNGGQISMIGAKTVSGISFENNGYSGDPNGIGSNGGTTNLDVTNATISATPGVTGQINARLIGTGTVTVNGGGTVIFNNTSARIGSYNGGPPDTNTDTQFKPTINVTGAGTTLQLGGFGRGFMGIDPNQVNGGNGIQNFPVVNLDAGTTFTLAHQQGSESGVNLIPITLTGHGGVHVIGNTSAETVYGDCTYDGPTVIESGSQLRMGAGGSTTPSGSLGATAVTLNGTGQLRLRNDSQNRTFPGSTGGTGTLYFEGSNVTTVTGVNNPGGGTTINNGSGTVVLANTTGNALAGPVNISSGTLRLASNTSDITGAALTVGGNSTIDLAGSSGTFAFGDSSAAGWNGSAFLNIADWNGSTAGGGAEQLKFGSSSGALSAAQLAQLQFVNPFGLAPGTYSAVFSGSNPGEVVPTPEPGSIALLGLGSLALLRRRRRA